MPRTCGVCRHERLNEIDAALVAGQPYRRIAQQFAASPDAVNRHKAHVTSKMAKAHEAAEVADAGRLLSKLQRLEERAEGLLTAAEAKGQLGPAASLLRELRELLRLFGEISGELKGGGGLTINLLASSEWQELQRKILAALEPYPEARLSVARALLPAGNGGKPPDA